MSPASIQTPVFISYCSPVQGRIAGDSTSVYEFDNVVRGQHFIKVHGCHSLTKHISVPGSGGPLGSISLSLLHLGHQLTLSIWTVPWLR